ncbi:Uncharacterised protein [Salmonella enterica subsp. enterica serovar Typhimurium str. DT104]|nr:Uncharacterised protein [Salmonella enterica subsp. enterica serovar Typhimurium str. DT104]CNO10931.1 Uncharacterised protein [Salmonella enterica subsp. enterica serovar Typhimurium str. DT104]CNO18426.1 Uncharacterised protein [Salmonella enterica subsp. enterica serovar Typhimurium str. DT104]CNP13282.1 Uncharacterised protein [Salmonella enterica subsp. enterica serovar Typhimurium str. DT104]CNP30672.1 Uncharacterised protein [Salmonella enterica subsp. enterica serovar Typhimurium str
MSFHVQKDLHCRYFDFLCYSDLLFCIMYDKQTFNLFSCDFVVKHSDLFCLHGRKDRKNDLFQNKHLYIIPGIKFVSFGNFLSQHQIEPEIIQ